jgi:hypothetical protein
MSDSKKLFSAREAAQAVLKKTQEILTESSLMKAEKLRKDGETLGSAIGYPGSPPPPVSKKELVKYETENRKPAGNRYGPIEKDVKKDDPKTFNNYEPKPGDSKDSSEPRVTKQVSPSKNPKEEAEGNNKPDGMEPRYEFRGKVKKELDKENKAAHHEPKDVTGNPGINKAENPDKDADAKLGEKVENDVEDHMLANKAAEKKEGHKIMKKSDQNMPAAQPKAEGPTEQASIPRLILSAKLAKFMEHKHSKRKNAEAQGQQAVGQNGPAAPQQGSTQAGQPDPTRPATQPKTGDEDLMGKSYEGFKAVEASAAKSGASNPAAVAAAAGMKKYGKKKFEEAAHEGKKMGHKK